MKVATFTDDPNVLDPAAWEEQRVVNAQEWSRTRRQGADIFPGTREKFRDRQAFLDYLARYEDQPLRLGHWLNGYLRQVGARNILGLCSGEGPVEYALKRADPGWTIVATDFDPFVVQKVSEYLPELGGVELCDIKQDDFSRFQGKFDTALMVASFYLLNDDEVRSLMRRLAAAGITRLVVATTSLISTRAALKAKGKHAAARILISLGLYRFPLRFHGWARTRSEFFRLSHPHYVVAELVNLKDVYGYSIIRLELRD
jgi:SAM-dependent methyltransferase